LMLNDVSFRAAFLYAIEGLGQGSLGTNWGDGLATNRQLLQFSGASDPNPFFQSLLKAPYRWGGTPCHYVQVPVAGCSGGDAAAKMPMLECCMHALGDSRIHFAIGTSIECSICMLLICRPWCCAGRRSS
jgi:hypothetical protein